ncbi:MAG: hypothetical protein PHX43_03770 [Alphaproteobacteria bacterium]|nr:hypothetical protein [Alphaproteobacteria bacterium]
MKIIPIKFSFMLSLTLGLFALTGCMPYDRLMGYDTAAPKTSSDDLHNPVVLPPPAQLKPDTAQTVPTDLVKKEKKTTVKSGKKSTKAKAVKGKKKKSKKSKTAKTPAPIPENIVKEPEKAPEPPPEVKPQSSVAPSKKRPEKWCYRTIGGVADCYSEPQADSPDRLITVDPPDLHPKTRQEYKNRLSETR